MGAPLYIVGLGGTTRPESSTERALRLALAHAAQLGCETRLLGAAEMPQEPYDPGRPDRSDAARTLVAELRRADGVIIASPSYHGGISGLVKNAIDFIEDLRDDPRVYLEGRAVGCIVCAEGPQAMGATLMAMRSIIHTLRGWPTPYGAAINTSTRPFAGPVEPAVRQALETVAAEVVAFARRRSG